MRSRDLSTRLLGELARPRADDADDAVDPVGAWSRSGGMWLTGRAGQAPLAGGAGAGAVAEHLLQDWALEATRRLGRRPEPVDAAVLGERAALAGLTRRGVTSCGGATRLLPCDGGLLALSLARDDDLAMVPALTGRDTEGTDAWAAVTAWASRTPAAEGAAWARVLGLPAAAVAAPADATATRPAVVVTDGAARVVRDRPLLVDLSSLWAGPLCAHLLGLAGADVVKVESVTRPDGARRGNAAFYDLLHAGHRSVGLDFGDSSDREVLRRLVLSADVVLESSRPRALARLGVSAAEALVAGVTWVSITAYGRDEGADLVGFGDDVAAGAGLVASDAHGTVFAGDALADPLTGLAAATACLRSLGGERAQLLDVAMHRVARVAASIAVPETETVRSGTGWLVDDGTRQYDVARPRARRPASAAAALGADTHSLWAEQSR
jgi:hypothetical protein